MEISVARDRSLPGGTLARAFRGDHRRDRDRGHGKPGSRHRGGTGGNGTHIARHFYSTVLQDAGISPVGVTSFMGHSVKALPVTFRVYGHVTEETIDLARDVVDRTLYKLRPVPSSGTVAELRSAQ